MRRTLLLLPLMALMPIASQAEGSDDGALWTEIGIQKSVNRQWKVGLETEMRAQKETRWSIGANATYKPVKYLKLGAAYNFQYRKHPETTKPHYDKDDGQYDGYNVDEKYWTPRHRLSIDATGTVKVGRWLRISLRERYQFTHRAEVDYTRTQYRCETILDGNGNFLEYEWDDPKEKERTKPAEGDHVLRSRLKLEMDKKHCPWSPYLSLETHNSLNSGQKLNLEKVRTGIGCDYKINKQHSIGLAYILTAYIHDEEAPHARLHERIHAANVSYQFEF